MGTPEDDGWINAEDYDGYIPFEVKKKMKRGWQLFMRNRLQQIS